MASMCSCGGMRWGNRSHVCGTRCYRCGGMEYENKPHFCGYLPDYSKPPTDYEMWRGLRGSDEWLGAPIWNTRNQEKKSKNQETKSWAEIQQELKEILKRLDSYSLQSTKNETEHQVFDEIPEKLSKIEPVQISESESVNLKVFGSEVNVASYVDSKENDQHEIGFLSQDMGVELVLEIPRAFSSETKEFLDDDSRNGAKEIDPNRDEIYEEYSSGDKFNNEAPFNVSNDILDIESPFVMPNTSMAAHVQMNVVRDKLSMQFGHTSQGIIGDHSVPLYLFNMMVTHGNSDDKDLFKRRERVYRWHKWKSKLWESKISSKILSTLSKKKDNVSYLLQSNQSVVGSILETGKTKRVTSWDLISRSSHNIESLSNWNKENQETIIGTIKQPEKFDKKQTKSGKVNLKTTRANGIELACGGMINTTLLDAVLDVGEEKKPVRIQVSVQVQQCVDAIKDYGITLHNFALIRDQQIRGILSFTAENEPKFSDKTSTELRDQLLAFDPLNKDHVKTINEAKAEFWKRPEGYIVGWNFRVLRFDCGGQKWVSQPNMKDFKYIEDVMELNEKEEIRWIICSKSYPISSSFDIFSWVEAPKEKVKKSKHTCLGVGYRAMLSAGFYLLAKVE